MAEHKQVVLVTGASSGIGAAAAALLHERGYTVFGTSRAAEIPPAPGIDMLDLDVREDDEVAACVGTVLERAGRIDVLVNNAGYAHRGPLELVTLDDFRAQFETNLYGVHRMVQAVLPGMLERGSGRIVNVSSAIGRRAIPFSGAYCASKFALEGYSESLALELKPHGVDVVIVEPGMTDTPFHHNATHADGDAARYQAQIAQRRAALGGAQRPADTAEDVAAVILRAVADEQPELRYLAPMAQKSLGVAT